MRTSNILPFALSLLFISYQTASAIPFSSEDPDDDYDETARVVRISFLRGEASLKHADDSQSEQATINTALVEGDAISTNNDSYAEIQFDSRNFVRLSALSTIRIVTLRDEGVALSLEAGTATIRLARFDHEREYFEVDAPSVTIAAENAGVYRLNVGGDGDVEVIARDGARARIYSETSGFTLRENKRARLIRNGNEAGDWELGAIGPVDAWDRWTDERELYLLSRLRYDGEEKYYDRDVWGAEELNGYGDWSYAETYGWVWRPHATIVNRYADWTPYRYGRWRWCAPYGWTWVGDEPWGWAPYHHGRWVQYNNNWCWSPRGSNFGQHHRNFWRPALVAFVYVPSPRGEYIAWYPLGFKQHDPRARFYNQQSFARRDEHRTLRAGEIPNSPAVNPIYQRAVNALPARDFGSRNATLVRAPNEIAQRAIAGEPVTGSLPVRPHGAIIINNSSDPRTRQNAGRFEGADASRRSSAGMPVQVVPERLTGAARRVPGQSLDEGLRRARIFQGREPRAARDDKRVDDERNERREGIFERTRKPETQRGLERRRVSGEASETQTPAAQIERPAPRDNRAGDDAGASADSDRRSRLSREKEGFGNTPPIRRVNENATQASPRADENRHHVIEENERRQRHERWERSRPAVDVAPRTDDNNENRVNAERRGRSDARERRPETEDRQRREDRQTSPQRTQNAPESHPAVAPQSPPPQQSSPPQRPSPRENTERRSERSAPMRPAGRINQQR